MANQAKQDRPAPRITELPHHSYQPSVAELNEDMRVDVSFEELVKAVVERVRIRYVVPPESASSRCTSFATYVRNSHSRDAVTLRACC